MANPFAEFEVPAGPRKAVGGREAAPSSANPFAEFEVPKAPSNERTFTGAALEGVKALPGDILTMAGGLLDVAAGVPRAAAKAVLPAQMFSAIDTSMGAPGAGERATNAFNTVARDLPQGLFTKGVEAVLPADTLAGIRARAPFAEQANPELQARAKATADAFIDSYAAYGDKQKFLEKLATQPTSVLADLSLGLGLGAKVAPAGRIAEALERASVLTDPIRGTANALQVTGNALARPVTAVSNLFTPSANMLVPALEGRGAAYVPILRGEGNVIVPGSKPTAAEVLAGAGVSGTQFPALQQRLLKENMPTAAAELEAAQTAARQRSIGSIAETPANLEQARTTRAVNAKANYEGPMAVEVAADEKLARMLQTPAMQDAVRTAQKNAANEQRLFKTGEDVPAQTVTSTVMGPDGKPLTREAPAAFATYPGQSLHDIKLALDEMIKSSPGVTAAERAEQRTIKSVRDQFVGWMENKLPGYKTARETFAAESKPINVMEVGKVLEQALTSPLNEGVSRPGVFATAVRNAPATIKKATGDTRFQTLSDTLEAGDSQKVSNILQDLARTDEYKRLAQRGAEQAKTLEAGNIPRTPAFFSWIATAANKIAGALEGRIQSATAIRLAEAMLDPATAATAIEKAMATKANTAARGAAVRAPFNAAAEAARAAAPYGSPILTINRLAPPQENRNAMAR